MKNKKNKKILLSLLGLLPIPFVGVTVASCAKDQLSVNEQKRMEIDPIFEGYESYNFNGVLATKFLETISQIIRFDSNSKINYRYLESNINPFDEDAIDVFLEYEYNNKNYRYKKTYQNFSSAALERKRIENQTYLDSSSNASNVEILPTYDTNKYKIKETTSKEATKWPLDAFIFNSSNKELKFKLLNIVDNENDTINLNIKVELGENKTYASKIYHKTISGFLKQSERNQQVANQAEVDNEQNHLELTIKNETTKQATRSSVLENYKNLFNVPTKEGFVFEIIDAVAKENSKTAIIFRIKISKGSGTSLASKIYTKEIDGFVADK